MLGGLIGLAWLEHILFDSLHNNYYCAIDRIITDERVAIRRCNEVLTWYLGRTLNSLYRFNSKIHIVIIKHISKVVQNQDYQCITKILCVIQGLVIIKCYA